MNRVNKSLCIFIVNVKQRNIYDTRVTVNMSPVAEMKLKVPTSGRKYKDKKAVDRGGLFRWQCAKERWEQDVSVCALKPC